MIGVISDSHNSQNHLTAALEEIRSRGITELIHCGDIRGSKMLPSFDGFRAYFVLGNADREPAELRRAIRERFGPDAVGTVLTFERGGKRIGVTHGHTSELSQLIDSGRYDYVLHGHTHRRRDEIIGSTRVLNPGALGGIKKESRSYALLDPERDLVEFVELAE